MHQVGSKSKLMQLGDDSNGGHIVSIVGSENGVKNLD